MDLREYLFRYRITQKKFAELVEVTPQHIYSIVNGKTKPGKRLAKAISDATQGLVLVSDLLKKTADKKVA